VVDIEYSEGSEDDPKKPAKISSTKPKKVADSMDLDSKSSKEEKHSDKNNQKLRLRTSFDYGCSATMINKRFIRHCQQMPVKTNKWFTIRLVVSSFKQEEL
jgi:hypothetical protein